MIKEIESSLKSKEASLRARAVSMFMCWRCTQRSQLNWRRVLLGRACERAVFSEKLIKLIYTSTSDGVERVTDGYTDKASMAEDEEQVDGDEPGEALDPLRRRVCRQPTLAEI